jgi:2Fe-2S ferredoxin
MIDVQFTEFNGTEHRVSVAPGITLMRAAIDHRIPGVLAECGGMCACATCHVFIDDAWRARLPPPDETEAGMLQGAIDPTAQSRLACQVVLTPELSGLTVRLPETQI